MTNLRCVRRGVLGGLGHEFLLSRGVNLLQSILGNEGFVLKILATQKASGPNGSRENPLGAVRFVGRLHSHLKRLADPLGQFPMIDRRGGRGAVTCPKHVLLGLGGGQGRFAPFHRGLIPVGGHVEQN